MKRATKEGNASANGLSAGKTRYRLIDHRLKDRCGKICRGRPLIDKRLNIGLGKHTATCGDRIDFLIVFRCLVESFGIGLQECRHLIDKRTRTARTHTVHAFFKTAREIDDLRILTAKLDGNVSLRCNLFECRCDRHDLLNKFNAKGFTEIDRARSRYFYFQSTVTKRSLCFFQKLGKCFLRFRHVASVLSVYDMILGIQHHELDRCGADVDACTICIQCIFSYCGFESIYFHSFVLSLFLDFIISKIA